jgi:hypothetical protein
MCHGFLAYIIHGQWAKNKNFRMPSWACGSDWIRKYIFNGTVKSPDPKFLNRKITGFKQKPNSKGIPQAAMKESVNTQLDLMREAERIRDIQNVKNLPIDFDLREVLDLLAQNNLRMSLLVAQYRASLQIPLLKTPDTKLPAMETHTIRRAPNRVSLLTQRSPLPEDERSALSLEPNQVDHWEELNAAHDKKAMEEALIHDNMMIDNNKNAMAKAVKKAAKNGHPIPSFAAAPINGNSSSSSDSEEEFPNTNYSTPTPIVRRKVRRKTIQNNYFL